MECHIGMNKDIELLRRLTHKCEKHLNHVVGYKNPLDIDIVGNQSAGVQIYKECGFAALA
jgi:hypothetical protein